MTENTGAPDTEIAETIAEIAVHNAPTEYSKIPYVIELESAAEDTPDPQPRTAQDETKLANPCPPPAPSPNDPT